MATVHLICDPKPARAVAPQTFPRTAPFLAAPPTSPGARGTSALDSAANIASRGATPSPSSRPARAGSPVAYEAPVVATGARTEENSGKRELFKEATTTALVFPNGGVIRLAAALAPGQLLFLTNRQTKREVVAQVTRKRTNPSAGYYIELEFTEPAPGFWGIEFPENPAALPASPQQPTPVELELLQSPEPAADDISQTVEAPSEAEVQALVEEVEALRAQLRSMQTQTVAANTNPTALADQILQMSSTPAPPSRSLAQPEVPRLAAPAASSAPLPPISEMLSSLLGPTPAPQPVPQPPPASAPVEDSVPGATSAPAQPPHSEQAQFVPDAEQSVAKEDLPEPALDFQQANKARKTSPPREANAAAAASAASADRSGLLRLALLAVVSLFAVMVAAWNMHWLPWLSGPASLPTNASSPARPAATSSSPARQVPQQKSEPRTAATATPQIPSTSPSQPDSAATKLDSPFTQATSSDAKSNVREEPVSRVDAAANPTPGENRSPVLSVAKRSVVRPSQPAQAISTSPLDDNTAIVPPRLIKAVRAVAPGDALRSFVTGNVTLDALIDKSGHVQSMKVLSGPPSFHKAALEALKQYRYEPARQHGQPISAHLTVTVPFLFEP